MNLTLNSNIRELVLLTLSLWKDEERDWQVIGNIYENPELLEAGNDSK